MELLMLVVVREPSAVPLLSSLFYSYTLFLHELNQDAPRYPEIKRFIVQDLPETKEAAESYIASQDLSHKVAFEAQDFFKPQQRKGRYVYVMQRGMSTSPLSGVQKK